LYRGKGPRNQCSSYRRITLLSVPGKVFAHVLLAQLQPLLTFKRRLQQSGLSTTTPFWPWNSCQRFTASSIDLMSVLQTSTWSRKPKNPLCRAKFHTDRFIYGDFWPKTFKNSEFCKPLIDIHEICNFYAPMGSTRLGYHSVHDWVRYKQKTAIRQFSPKFLGPLHKNYGSDLKN